MSLHPALQHAKDALLTRRGLRHQFGHPAVGKTRHQPMQVAYQGAGAGFSFRILYCPACLRGQVVDLVREVPEEAAYARELGLRQMRPWRVECTSAAEERRAAKT